jgi:aryl-phospho-beta-D-glucosidase BglC (GH1 family)
MFAIRMRKKLLILLCGLILSCSGSTQILPTAMDTYNAMTIGWNIGNTMEAIGGETNWGNPLVTQSLINSVKAAGFNSVRIPCSWNQYADASNNISSTWMARVTQVVDYCINQNMYVVLNIHWDGGWLENNVTTTAQAGVNSKQQAFWTQIANNFKNYDKHLLFASANEPNANDATSMSVLLSYHQTFVNAVRATGGNNSSRTLIIQGPSTDIDLTSSLMNTMPTDAIADRLMVEIHDYTPYQLTLMNADASWGNQFFYWGTGYHSTTDAAHNATWGEESYIESSFNKMKTKFVDNCIPVIIGEFGAMRRTAGSSTGPSSAANLTKHLASRVYFYQYISDAARRYGMRLFIWDTGYTKSSGTLPADNSMTVINRSTGAVVDPNIMSALLTGFNNGTNTISGCATALPVNYLSFTGEQQEGTSNIVLKWAIDDKQDSDHFEVMRSSDGITWTKIGEVASDAYNILLPLEYTYTDTSAEPAKVNYYKIIEVGLNGAITVSKMISVSPYFTNDFKVLPNPNTGIFTVGLNGFQEKVYVSMYDALGKLIYTSSTSSGTAKYIEIYLPELRDGIYYLSIADSRGSRCKKVVVE